MISDCNGWGDDWGNSRGKGLSLGRGDGYVLRKHIGQKVYYVDAIPCLPQRVDKGFAFVDVIGKEDLRTAPMVIAARRGKAWIVCAWQDQE